jgi:hypothetical protein
MHIFIYLLKFNFKNKKAEKWRRQDIVRGEKELFTIYNSKLIQNFNFNIQKIIH